MDLLLLRRIISPSSVADINILNSHAASESKYNIDGKSSMSCLINDSLTNEKYKFQKTINDKILYKLEPLNKVESCYFPDLKNDDKNYYFIDGVKVKSASDVKLNANDVAEITGGIPANYGDVTGGIVSIKQSDLLNPNGAFNNKLNSSSNKFNGLMSTNATSEENLDRRIYQESDYIDYDDDDLSSNLYYNDSIVLDLSIIEDNNTSTFKQYKENEFKSPKNEPLSTLSVDVDKASLPTFRSYVENGTRAPKDAVRIEEFINYFNYDYAAPTGDMPVAIHTDYSASPWNKKGMLLKLGLKGKEVTRNDSKHSNLVFLIDVSGSMSDEDKLPLLEQSLNLLVDQLEEEDYISIVTYAGSAGLVLPATSGMYKDKIKQAIDGLAAGGSTAGADGITLAYEQAQLNYRAGHNNRVILATDGDFNVGVSSDKGLEDLIVEKRETGIELSVLGFGDGNFQSSKMENLAQNGNGNFSYLDNLKEAKKVLVEEMSGTLQTIAKDVKLQVEFNPLVVGAYRLIGYENRILAHQDFNNDKVDASDMGAGHTITAVYEIIPVSLMDDDIRKNLKYQKVETTTLIGDTNELATISMRYKEPGGDVSKKVQHIALNKVENASVDFTFIKGVIGFCQLYKRSKYRGDLSLQHIVDLLKDGKGKDKQGYRKSFINLIKDVKFE